MKDLGPHGPDAFMELRFRPEDGPDVLEILRGLKLPAFARRSYAAHSLGSEFRAALEPAQAEILADAFHAERIFGNLEGRHAVNVWIYALVSAGSGRVWFEHGYALNEPRVLRDETRIVDALTAGGTVRLEGWSVEYGGQGYRQGVLKEGRDAASLRVYLGLA